MRLIGTKYPPWLAVHFCQVGSTGKHPCKPLKQRLVYKLVDKETSVLAVTFTNEKQCFSICTILIKGTCRIPATKLKKNNSHPEIAMTAASSKPLTGLDCWGWYLGRGRPLYYLQFSPFHPYNTATVSMYLMCHEMYSVCMCLLYNSLLPILLHFKNFSSLCL